MNYSMKARHVMLFFISAFFISGVASMMSLQNNECEVRGSDGAMKYYACIAEPLHLLRNALFNIKVNPPEGTCGNPRTPFCTLGFRNCSFCDAAIAGDAHPPTFIYDNQPSSNLPNLATWWQSSTWTQYPTPLHINITMSFNKSYEFQDDLTITFRSSRPQRMILEKSVDFGVTWEPLQYYDRNCRRFYNLGAGRFTTPEKPDQVVCAREYSLEVPYMNGVVKFPVVQDRYELFLGAALTNYRALYRAYNNTNLKDFLTFTDLRIQLLYPSTDGKESLRKEEDLIRYYYAIADMEVIGGCHCNLHAKICKVESGRTVCDCRHNTEGDNCERCQSLYNARPWQPGFYEPYPKGTANECQKCQCYDHATTCQYNATMKRGICMGCVHNTTGMQCERCLPGYFRNFSLPLTSPYICADCDCEWLGVLNGDMRCLPPEGQCPCKPLVAGRRCDTCVDQYYGLLLDTIGQGQCKPCLCNLVGTLAQSNVCEKREGQCPCKPHITGRDCSVCQDGFYDFPRARPWADCTDCNCDKGGSSDYVCDKAIGQCTCRPGVIGRRCDEATTGFYSSALDAIQLQPRSGTCQLATDLSTTQQPFTGRMFMRCFATQTAILDEIPIITQQADIVWPYVPVLRYSLNTSSVPWPSASLDIAVLGNSGVDMTWYRENVNESLGPNCGQVTGFLVTFTYTNLSAGYGQAAESDKSVTLDPRCRYAVILTVGPAGGATGPLLVDSLVISPDITFSKIYTDSENATKEEYDDCFQRIMAVSQRSEALEFYRCQWLTFSVGSQLHLGGLTCGCSLIGTQPGTVCDPLGGQCSCKPGVIGRRCDLCEPGFFNFTLSGCQACNCNRLGSTSLVCDYNTGQCPCLPFVALVGQNTTRGQHGDLRCSSCVRDYYGFQTGAGCQLCVCSVAGSASPQCDDLGVCTCKETIGGERCDQCRQGFYAFSAAGCLPCNCTVAGSTSAICDFNTGQCQCKPNVRGAKCDLCAGDSFNIVGANPDGCQKCFCYGHGTICSSAPGYTKRVIYSGTIMSSNWTDSTPLVLMDSSWLSARGLMTSDLQYVQAPPEFLGNQVNSYGQFLTVDIRVLGGNDILLAGYRPIILQGNGKTIYYDVGNLTITRDFRRAELMLTEHFWSYNTTSRPDYFNMYAILADLQAIHLQRAFGLQTIMIFNVTLVSAQPARTGEPQVSYVELCDCDASRNTQGLSCEECSAGTQRQTVNGSVYETCKPCSCNGRGQTAPPLCHPGTGQCLNCRNGTVGDNCQTCAPNVIGLQCDTCADRFWGLQEDGCRACECDTVGSTGGVCDKLDGQCSCKPNVVSRKCDECADNYYNLQPTGCQECDACYGLVNQEVETLRAMRDNLTLFVSNLQQQDNNTILGPFTQRLDNTLRQMNTLLQFLNEAQRVSGSVTPQLAQLEASLRHLEEAVDIDIAAGTFTVNNTVNHVENLIIRAQRIHGDISATVLQASQIITGPISSMTTTMRALLASLQGVETALSQLSTGAMADANRIMAMVRQIESDTNLAKSTADGALQAAQNAETVHTDTRQRIAELKRYVSLVSRLGESVTAAAQNTLGNASLALEEVMVALKNSTAMEIIPIDGAAIQRRAAELKTAAQALEFKATIAENIVEAGNVTIIHDVAVAKTQTAALNSRVADLVAQSGNVIGRFKNAYEMAMYATGNETKVFEDATTMLSIMQDFSNRAQAVELQANSSLALVQRVRGLSETSIASAQNMQSSLKVTFRSAQESLTTANNSQQLASQEEQSYRPVYQEALQLDAYSKPLLTDIRQVASNVYQATQEEIEPARITCQGLESQVRAVENRTRVGEVQAQAAAAVAAATKVKLDAILTSLRNINKLDMATLDALRRRVRETRQEFDERQLAEAVELLQVASREQRAWLTELQRRRDEAAVAVRRMRDVQGQFLP